MRINDTTVNVHASGLADGSYRLVADMAKFNFGDQSTAVVLWLRISHELYPEGLEYELFCAAEGNDTRAARLLQSLPWRRLTDEENEVK